MPDAATFRAVANRTWQGMCQCRRCTGRFEPSETLLVVEQLVVSLALVDVVDAPKSHSIVLTDWTLRIQK